MSKSDIKKALKRIKELSYIRKGTGHEECLLWEKLILSNQ